MGKKWIFVLALVGHTLTVALAQNPDLRLLNLKERIDYIRAQKFPGSKVIIKDTTGAILKGFNLNFPVRDGELYSAQDYYVDNDGKITEIIVRLPQQRDLELNRRLFDVDEDLLRGTMEPVKTDCKRQKEILAGVLAHELENRKNDQVIDAELDNHQEAVVTGLLQQCGTPSLALVGSDGIRAIWLVLLHSRRKNQEKYKPVLEGYMKSNFLRKGATVVLEDRLRMASGRKQLYGTQVVFFARTGYALFPCDDFAAIDARRAAMGLPGIDEYLRQREQFYGAEIER